MLSLEAAGDQLPTEEKRAILATGALRQGYLDCDVYTSFF